MMYLTVLAGLLFLMGFVQTFLGSPIVAAGAFIGSGLFSVAYAIVAKK